MTRRLAIGSSEGKQIIYDLEEGQIIHEFKDTEGFKYHNLCIRPFDWTILHYMTIFKPTYLVSLHTYSKARIFLLTDKAMKTPLHYLLAQTHSKSDLVLQNKIFTYMLDYLEENK